MRSCPRPPSRMSAPSARRSLGTYAGAPGTCRLWRPLRTLRPGCGPYTTRRKLSETMDQPRYRWISARVRPKEDYRFVTGRGHFAADVRLPGMTRVATVPSAHAHARIVSIDLTAALAVPGAVGIITGEDLRRDVEPIPQYAAVTGVNWESLAAAKAAFARAMGAVAVDEHRFTADDAVHPV